MKKVVVTTLCVASLGCTEEPEFTSMEAAANNPEAAAGSGGMSAGEGSAPRMDDLPPGAGGSGGAEGIGGAGGASTGGSAGGAAGMQSGGAGGAAGSGGSPEEEEPEGGEMADAAVPQAEALWTLYDDAVDSDFALHVPHDSEEAAQPSEGDDSAYLSVDTAYDGVEAFSGSSIEAEFVTVDDTGNFGLPLAFWVQNVGYNPGESLDVTVGTGISFRIKASAPGVMNVLAMSEENTSTSRNVAIGTTWSDVTLSAADGADWVVYFDDSFQNFGALQFNFLGGANPPDGFVGGTFIYIDDVRIE